jgi:DNA-binding CsgD family transcriptional regulator
VFWHANVVLAAGGDEYVEISLKRRVELGPYQRSDAATLDTVLPELRAAARIAKATLDAGIGGMQRLLRHRGQTIVELDGRGRVMSGQAIGETDPASPLRISGRRLTAASRAAQPGLERAIAAALLPPGRMALAPLAGPDGRRYVLQVHPVPSRTRDIFLSAAAIAVLIERDREPAAVRPDPSAIRELFGLTDREADVASLLAEGLDIAAIAGVLRISPETARTYLKYAFEKIGVSRQAELVALLARLRQ